MKLSCQAKTSLLTGIAFIVTMFVFGIILPELISSKLPLFLIFSITIIIFAFIPFSISIIAKKIIYKKNKSKLLKLIQRCVL